MDPDSAHWLRTLNGDGVERDQAVARLHELLLRIARSEVHRRSQLTRVVGPELDDLAHQAAADALMAIITKLDQFRGESRFTTWAYKFVIFEVSGKLARHMWRTPTVALESEDWDRLPDRFGLDPVVDAQARELTAALRRAVDAELTERQRRVFVAIVLHGIALDVVAAEHGSNRNAIYKMMFDARRKLRANLVANGYLDAQTGGDNDGESRRS
jgi:RNA polymerase sigma-70 factor (ECF subfamily)